MKKFTLSVSLILTFAFISVNAQTTISPEKQKAIQELSSLISADNAAEDLAKAIMSQLNKMQPEIVKSILDGRTDLTREEKEALEKTLIADALVSAEKFQTKLFEKLDYNAVMSEILIGIYDKYYSLEEINDLIVFYRTPTGQKTLKNIQPIMQETMQLTQAKLMPKLLVVIEELRNERREQTAKRADELKPRKSKANNK
jgi:uncharacterized protein